MAILSNARKAVKALVLLWIHLLSNTVINTKTVAPYETKGKVS